MGKSNGSGCVPTIKIPKWDGNLIIGTPSVGYSAIIPGTKGISVKWDERWKVSKTDTPNVYVCQIPLEFLIPYEGNARVKVGIPEGEVDKTYASMAKNFDPALLRFSGVPVLKVVNENKKEHFLVTAVVLENGNKTLMRLMRLIEEKVVAGIKNVTVTVTFGRTETSILKSMVSANNGGVELSPLELALTAIRLKYSKESEQEDMIKSAIGVGKPTTKSSNYWVNELGVLQSLPETRVTHDRAVGLMNILLLPDNVSLLVGLLNGSVNSVLVEQALKDFDGTDAELISSLNEAVLAAGDGLSPAAAAAAYRNTPSFMSKAKGGPQDKGIPDDKGIPLSTMEKLLDHLKVSSSKTANFLMKVVSLKSGTNEIKAFTNKVDIFEAFVATAVRLCGDEVEQLDKDNMKPVGMFETFRQMTMALSQGVETSALSESKIKEFIELLSELSVE